MIDVEAAARALAATGSRFFTEAARWLVAWDDPVPLLLVLTKETGPALGPWATFRWCALLGLTPSRAVRALAEDVVVEDVPVLQGAPPVDAAFAIAHAHDVWKDLPRDNVEVAAGALGSPVDPLAVSAALALAHVSPDGPARRPILVERLRETLADPALVAHAPLALEAALLGDQAPVLVEAAGAVLARSQREDGTFPSVRGGPRDDRFATLRALALDARLVRGRPSSSS